MADIKYPKQAREIQELCDRLDIDTSGMEGWTKLAERLAIEPETMRKVGRGYQKASPLLMQALRNIAPPPMELRDAPSAHYNVKHIGRVERGNRIPVISFTRAGSIEFDYADLDEQMDDFIESAIKDPNAFGLVVEGDSMEPKISAGDVVVVAPNDRPRNGDLVVARLAKTEGVLLKIFNSDGERIRLSSYNPAYLPLTFVEKDFSFIYPVHSRTTRWRR